MIQRILVAYDGSAAALKAFDAAVDLARKYGAALEVLSVAPSPEIGDDVETEAVIEQGRRQHQAILDRLQQRAQHLGMAIKSHLMVGHPANQIIEQAAVLKADLIVMGHRGHGAIDRWKIGSVTRRVISYAECAVMVVR